ncbi:MAG: alpha/beta hydrolase [Candidatus Solibacter usitatus]|nr:alpha/beta hydrolase [Candidatus Solibacter usitatus]
MAKYYMISNRVLQGGDLANIRGPLSFRLNDTETLQDLASWRTVSADDFKKEILTAADDFPDLTPEESQAQKHVTLFIHGFNNTWRDAVKRYQTIVNKLFKGKAGLGLCICFTWPSDGAALGYFPDRETARETAPDLADVLNHFYEWLLLKQKAAMKNPDKACKAKTSVIAHSMGNYVLQKAMQLTWTRQNQPLLVSLINQLLMVAADVDNDLFTDGGDDQSDGIAIANLTYRVTALYTGRDETLGLSAGLKHFGKRRLGRSGLDRSEKIPEDNVWDIDCSKLIPAKATNIHSAYFEPSSPKTLALMDQLLRGVDRKLIAPA